MAQKFEFKRAGALLGGANFKQHLPQLIRDHQTENLEVKLHEDCGAVKLVHAGVKDRDKVEWQIYNALVPPFLRRIASDPTLATQNHIEDLALEIQREIALEWKNITSLRQVNCTKIPTVGKVEGERTLLLTTPIMKNGTDSTVEVRCMDPRCRSENDPFDEVVKSLELDPKRTYVITLVPGDFREMVIDPKAAVKYLNILNVALYRGKEDRYGVIDRFHSALMRKDIELPNAQIKRYD